MTSVEEALRTAESFDGTVFSAGGASIYAQTIALADAMYLSYIKGHFTGVKPLRGGMQTVLVGGLAAAAAFFIARLIS